MGSAVISLIVGSATHPEYGWIEGTAILFAVVIVVAVGASNDWLKER
jgi:hypothetical protein